MFIEQCKLIIIAFIQRSGSSYMCDMLLRSGGFGTPCEYYSPLDFTERVEKWDASQIIDKSRVSNEISWFMEVLLCGGLKCNWDSHERMVEEVGELLDKVEIQYVYLRRRDKLRQAISWYRASMNGQWTHLDVKHPDPPYNRKEIDKYLRYIKLNETKWDNFLSGIKHLELFYEDLDYGVVDQYEAFTGLRRNKTLSIDSEYTILRDALTEEWVEKYAKSHNM